MFLGLNDGPGIIFMLERYLRIIKSYVKGEFQFPDKETMIEDMHKIEKMMPDLRSVYQSPPPLDWVFMKELYEFYSENCPDPLPNNVEFLEKMLQLLGGMFSNIFKGNWHDFKHPEMTGFDIMDSSEYF